MVAIICADSLREELISELRRRRIAFADAAAGRINSTINVLSAEESKGLEFDAVVVVEPAEIAEAHPRYLYIALTRCDSVPVTGPEPERQRAERAGSADGCSIH